MAFQEGLTVEGLVARLDQLQGVGQIGLFRAFEILRGLAQGQGIGVSGVGVRAGHLARIGLEAALAADLGQTAQAIAALGGPPDG
ncbi:hypothetical protein D3C72_2122790 [compost metagenome]